MNSLPLDKLEKTTVAPGQNHLMTIEEVSSYLQLKPETVRAMAREQSIPAFKIRRRWRFRREDVEAWVNQMARQP
jgi:excisionase family DNA binding protein